jgi:gas vesicle protein
MAHYDELPTIVIERRSGGLAPFVWGALIGAGAALLLAPRSGSQTQEEIREGVRRVRTAAEDRIEAARTTVTRTRERVQDQIDSVREQVENVRERIDTRTDQARDLLDSGRRAAREAREELERRVSDARSYPAASRPPAGGAGAEVIITGVTEERPEGQPERM